MTDRAPILAHTARGGGHAGRRHEDDRRRDAPGRPWLLMVGGVLGAGRFTAIHEVSGRSIRLDAGSRAQAELQVELLNRQALEMSV
jgi:hypothetical protein